MIGLALALDEARTTPLGCLPKLRMTVMVLEPFWEPDQPSRAARKRTAKAVGRSTKREGAT
jgi:hypothetical protein